ncbi:MAG: malonyl-ACP O-methyltransferase BioC [Pseudomonadales bacterium]
MLTAAVLTKREPLILLHGWGMNSSVWAGVIDALGEYFDVSALDLPGYGANVDEPCDYSWSSLMVWLEAKLPARAHLVGWSFGGNIAAEYAYRNPERVLSLQTVATSPSFVQREGWACAMAADTFQDFLSQVETDHHAALLQFAGLQAMGDEDSRKVIRQLRLAIKQAPELEQGVLLSSLTLLGELDQRDAWSSLQPPHVHWFAEHDSLVPQAVASIIPDSLILAGVAHAPMLSMPEYLIENLLGFYRQQAANTLQRDKRHVAESFSRAAPTYDSAAELQREVARASFTKVSAASDKTVVELGCGTGYSLPDLRRAYPQQQLVAVDLAEGMLRYARDHHTDLELDWLVGDAEKLPLADDSVGLLFSSLALQWCGDLVGLFVELKRVLAPGGQLVFSTLLDGTLGELRDAWSEVDDNVHVNHFFKADDWQLAASAAGLKGNWECETRVLYYDKLRDLAQELKLIGAHNVNQGRPEGMTGKRAYTKLCSSYEAFRVTRGLPATYQVCYGVLSHE